MTSKNHRHQSMQCPKCGSHNTQSVSVAYSQSIRTGYNGNQTISDFGRGLEPPPPKSAFWVPLGATYCVGMIVYFGIAALSTRLADSWPSVASSIDANPIVVSVIAGAVIGLLVSSSAITYNVGDHEGLMKKWKRDAVCKRCGKRFRS